VPAARFCDQVLNAPIAAGCDAELARAMAAFRDPQGFARLGDLFEAGTGGPAAKTTRSHTLRRAAVILAAKGGMLDGIQLGDLLELLDTQADVLGAAREARPRPATGCCASWEPSARQRRRGCGGCAPRASGPPRR
jgi:hypothetical protein